MAIKLLCLLLDKSWMTRLKTSLPTPLSPWMRTVRSVGDTRSAVDKALFKTSLLPMIPNRCFILCKLTFCYLVVILPNNVALLASYTLTST
jgi:hypothetical protein